MCVRILYWCFFFFFLAYFTLYNRLQFHPSHYKLFKCILFNGWVILHCVYVPQLSYPFICWWTSRLLPCPGYWRTVWRYLRKLEIELPYDPAIPLLFIHTEEIRTERDPCTPMFITICFKNGTFSLFQWRIACKNMVKKVFFI